MSEWINVEDALPVTAEELDISYRVQDCIVFDGQLVKFGTFQSGNTLSPWHKFGNNNITHWMPLPEPPEKT